MPETSNQSSVNNEAAEAAMTAEALEEIRESLGLTQAGMADMVQCDFTGYKRYATGSRPVPRYIARAAHLLDFIQRNGLQKKLMKYLSER